MVSRNLDFLACDLGHRGCVVPMGTHKSVWVFVDYDFSKFGVLHAMGFHVLV